MSDSSNYALDAEGFCLVDVFPNASDIFEGHYKALHTVKDDALVALDTNVLLAPYRLGSQPFGEMVKIFTALKGQDRLVLPAHVAREYARRRQKSLGELVQTLYDNLSRGRGVTPKELSVLDDDPDYKKAKEKTAEIEKLIDEAKKAIEKIANRLSDPATGDPVFSSYQKVFSGTVVELEKPDFSALKSEMQARYRAQVPPGYKDGAKPDNKEGDFLIWKTLLQVGRANKKDLIFVTGDEKGDWWSQRGGGAFQPRYELVDEYRRSSAGASIHIIPLHRLMKLFGAPEASVNAARRVEQEVAQHEPRRPSRLLLRLQLGQVETRRAELAQKLAELEALEGDDGESAEEIEELRHELSRARYKAHTLRNRLVALERSDIRRDNQG